MSIQIHTAAAPIAEAVPLARPRVLVVDDDGTARLLMKASLMGEYTIVEARDGREALEILEASPDFACVITDDRMPIVTGHEVAAHVRDSARLRHIPVLLVTAGDTNTATRQAEGTRTGAAAFLNKPFTRTQLTSIVRLVMRSRPAPRLA